MENSSIIIINGKSFELPQLSWLAEQDLDELTNYISLHVLEDVYRNGEETGLNAPLTKKHAKALFVLQVFLHSLKELNKAA